MRKLEINMYNHIIQREVSEMEAVLITFGVVYVVMGLIVFAMCIASTGLKNYKKSKFKLIVGCTLFPLLYNDSFLKWVDSDE